ncbi:MAG: MmcQ/YjbR family DNA-binding protein [Clostridia bacterium]|nr:MmcQ/YjbR family DNA-binding protein [Clostridia bacterium]
MVHRPSPEYLFTKYPSYAVFRHQSNKKWFAVIMRIPISKLGIMENREVSVVNLKCTPEAMDELWDSDGIFPAYHMNKRHWITVLLDGTVPTETVKKLLDVSFDATNVKIKKKQV